MMKSVLVLLVVAALGFASATEQAVAVSSDVEESNMDISEFDNAPFVPQNAEHDEVDSDDAEEETISNDEESDESDELEGNTEFEMEDAEAAFVEADSAAHKPLSLNKANPRAVAKKAKAAAKKVKKAAKKAAKKAKKAAKKAKKAAKKLKSKGKGKGKKARRPSPAVKGRGGRKGRRVPKIIDDDLWHYERHTPPGKAVDAETEKLNLAIEAVKEDILSTNKQIKEERNWVIAVAKLIAQYTDKTKRVESHIISLRKEMKSLYRKKKQIENLKLQRTLESKVREARGELGKLTSSLQIVQKKKGQLNKSGMDLKETIAGLQSQLAKLRGQKMFKPKRGAKKCPKGKRYSKRAKKCIPRRSRKGKKSHK